MSGAEPTAATATADTTTRRDSGNKKKKKMPAARKPPPRWRKYLVQAELELPPPVPGPRVHVASALQQAATDDGAIETTETELGWWQRTHVVAALALACVLLVAATGWTLWQAAQERAAAAAAEARAATLTLRAVSSERTLRITPNPRSWSAQPDATIGWPEPPQLLNLRLPVGYSEFQAFALLVDKVDHGRVMVVERITPDSNRELRLAVNSSAFGPGEYRLRLQGYTWRGERVDAGWARLVVTAPRLARAP